MAALPREPASAWLTAHATTDRLAAPPRSGFGESVKKVARKIQGKLPIVGLLSRLTSPGGGFDDESSYPEYCRTMIEASSPQFRDALMQLSERYKQVRPARQRDAGRGMPAAWHRPGHAWPATLCCCALISCCFGVHTHTQAANSRGILMVLWMVAEGAGLVPDAAILGAAKRLRVTQDLEMEMERFKLGREEGLKKYPLVAGQGPRAGLAKQAELAVDALALLVMGA